MRAGALIAVGLGTVGWFAVVGSAPRAYLAPDEITGILVIIVPVIIATSVRRMVPCGQVGWYVLGLFAAVGADVFVLRHGSWPAVLVGIVPAVPCFVRAGRVLRRAA